MASLLGRLGGIRRVSVGPTKTAGHLGTAIWSGYVRNDETDAALVGRERYKTFSQMLANTSIVAAGVRGFLNLGTKAAWELEPSEDDTDGEWADLASEILFDDPETPWHRIVRRALMFRFYGFSVQEWTATRRSDGIVTFKDVAPRAQKTIERWDVDIDGTVNGIVQRSPQTYEEIYLPRAKVLYVVDDSLSDSPEGLGLFRHMVDGNDRLKLFERLEGQGFDMDLAGIPVGRAPIAELDAAVSRGDITGDERTAAINELKEFMTNRRRNADKALLLDSMTYQTEDEAARPSNVPMWSIDVLQSSPETIEAVAASIERLNHELARIMGVEHMLLGSDSAGSFALSKEKTSAFALVVDGANREVCSAVDDDLIKTMWRLNAWPEEMRPKAKTESVQSHDAEQVAAALRDMASAGAVLAPDDPVINDVRTMMGVSVMDPDAMISDAALLGARQGDLFEDDDEMEMT